MTFDDLIKRTVYYDDPMIRHLIRFYRRSTSTVLRNRILLKIFLMNGKVVEAKINNFFYLFKGNKRLHVHYTKDDLIGESWINMTLCVERFDLEKSTKFLHYFNVSLLRYLTRLGSKQLRGNIYYANELVRSVDESDSSEISFFEKLLNQKRGKDFRYTTDDEFFNFLQVEMDLELIELRILFSRVSGEKMKFFLEENFDVNQSIYQSSLRSLKAKIKVFLNVKI